MECLRVAPPWLVLEHSLRSSHTLCPPSPLCHTAPQVECLRVAPPRLIPEQTGDMRLQMELSRAAKGYAGRWGVVLLGYSPQQLAPEHMAWGLGGYNPYLAPPPTHTTKHEHESGRKTHPYSSPVFISTPLRL